MIKLGTMVRVVHKPENVHQWPIWVSGMDDMLGKVGKVIEVESRGARVVIDGRRWMYAYDWIAEEADIVNGHAPGNIHVAQELPP